jgi:hypothetical protein
MLFPLTITALNQSGDALEGATIEVVDLLTGAAVDVYDIDGQVIASPVTDPDGMADLYLRNGYVKHRFSQGLYTSRWVTDLALAPSGRAGRWQDTTGGTIAAGATTDFTITVPDLGVEKTPRTSRWRRLTHPHMEDLTASARADGHLGATSAARRSSRIPGRPHGAAAFSGVVTFEHVAGDALGADDGSRTRHDLPTPSLVTTHDVRHRRPSARTGRPTYRASSARSCMSRRAPRQRRPGRCRAGSSVPPPRPRPGRRQPLS